MAIIKIELNQQDYERLVASAVREWRPLKFQAEVLMRRVLAAESQAERREEEHRYVGTAQQR
jgi:hypothetical protein